jgi:integrase/recombinase XerD
MRPADQVITQTNDLSDVQVKRLLDAIDINKPAGHLHKAILTLMFSTGIRKSELIHLKLEDYGDQEGFKIIRFMGKRGKLNRVPLHPSASYHLDRYILSMKAQGKLGLSTDWLFQPTRNHVGRRLTDKKLSPSSIDFIIKKYCRMIGVTTHVTPHSARATVIGSLLEQGCDLYRVSQMVNHANVKTTQGYDKRGKKISDSPVFHLKFF